MSPPQPHPRAALALLTLLLAGACDDSGGSSAADAAAQPDAPSGGADAAPADAAAPLADAAPAPDAPVASADAAPPPAPRLFATHDDQLVSFDLVTGEETVIGPITPEPYRLAFDGSTLWGLVAEDGPTYRLVTVDPCTGATTPGPLLNRPMGALHLPEGLAYGVDAAALFVSFGTVAAGSSPGLATVDTTAGTLTLVGSASGTLDGGDLDVLTAYQGGLLASDSSMPGGIWHTGYYTVNAATAAATSTGTPAANAHITGVAVHPETGVAYGWQLSGTHPTGLVTVDLASGSVTPVGIGSPGVSVRGFIFAAVSCPP